MLYMIASGLDTRLPLLRTVMHDVIRKIEQDRKLCLVLRTLNKLGFDVDEPVSRYEKGIIDRAYFIDYLFIRTCPGS